MKKRLMLIMLAVLTALCLAACAGCNEETPSKPSDTTYTVTVQDTENGTVSVSATSVKKGESVVITVTPDEHYVLDVLEVNGNAVAVTGKSHRGFEFSRQMILKQVKIMSGVLALRFLRFLLAH